MFLGHIILSLEGKRGWPILYIEDYNCQENQEEKHLNLKVIVPASLLESPYQYSQQLLGNFSRSIVKLAINDMKQMHLLHCRDIHVKGNGFFMPILHVGTDKFLIFKFSLFIHLF